MRCLSYFRDREKEQMQKVAEAKWRLDVPVALNGHGNLVNSSAERIGSFFLCAAAATAQARKVQATSVGASHGY